MIDFPHLYINKEEIVFWLLFFYQYWVNKKDHYFYFCQVYWCECKCTWRLISLIRCMRDLEQFYKYLRIHNKCLGMPQSELELLFGFGMEWQPSKANILSVDSLNPFSNKTFKYSLLFNNWMNFSILGCIQKQQSFFIINCRLSVLLDFTPKKMSWCFNLVIMIASTIL